MQREVKVTGTSIEVDAMQGLSQGGSKRKIVGNPSQFGMQCRSTVAELGNTVGYSRNG
jgi:hypothetical protein